MAESPLSVADLQAALEAMEYELVDVKVVGSSTSPAMQLRIDRIGGAERGHGVTTADCARVTRELEARLDAAGADSGRWRLDVSSPGIERPVRFAEHWRRFIGQEVRFRTAGLPGKQVGTIRGISDSEIVDLEVKGVVHHLPREAVRDATLMVDWTTIR